ncbi:protein lifeguard 1-like [Periplaneta americana]|uniref:protein lifeguard 1-like n=1 Tax=Periplaneta americana TaxID=6978 RepID=UPI0037E7DE1F
MSSTNGTKEQNLSGQHQQGKSPPPGYPPPGYLPYGHPYYNTSMVPTSDSPAYRPGRQQQESFEDEERFGISFSEKHVRAAFVRKVYTIITLQLLWTTAVCAVFMFIGLPMFLIQNFFIVYILLGVFFALAMVITCFQTLRRKSPINIILLAAFTIVMSLIVGIMTAFHDVLSVLLALGSTVIVCTIIILFACQTKYDITGCGPLLLVLGIAVMTYCLIVLILNIFYRYDKILHLVGAGLSTGLFSLYLMYDTQMIMGGRRIEISPEEHILAALQIYLDIINIFLNLLTIFGITRRL